MLERWREHTDVLSLNIFALKLCHSHLILFFFAVNGKKKSFPHQICMLEALNVALCFLHFCIATVLINMWFE